MSAANGVHRTTWPRLSRWAWIWTIHNRGTRQGYARTKQGAYRAARKAATR